MHWLRISLIALAAIFCAACSSAQLYGAGQAWQKAECNKIDDREERGRCMANANQPLDRYQRERDAAQGTAPR